MLNGPIPESILMSDRTYAHHAWISGNIQDSENSSPPIKLRFTTEHQLKISVIPPPDPRCISLHLLLSTD